jgi:hypothetical protein
LESKSTSISEFRYGKFKDLWHYSVTSGDGLPNKVLPQITYVSLVVTSKTFNPEKVKPLLNLFLSAYVTRGISTAILEAFLAVSVTNKYENSAGKWDGTTFDDDDALIKNSGLKDLIKIHGLEVVMIWNAAILKKRIAVYGDSLDSAQRVVRAIPQFIMHRKDWGILRPHFCMTPVETADLKRIGVYAVASSDSSIKTQENTIWDLLIDIPSQSITIAESCKGDFALGPIHKSIASFLVEAGEKNESEKNIMVGLAGKVKELRANLVNLGGGDGNVSLENIQAKKMAVHTEKFLWGLAVAEGISRK